MSTLSRNAIAATFFVALFGATSGPLQAAAAARKPKPSAYTPKQLLAFMSAAEKKGVFFLGHFPILFTQGKEKRGCIKNIEPRIVANYQVMYEVVTNKNQTPRGVARAMKEAFFNSFAPKQLQCFESVLNNNGANLIFWFFSGTSILEPINQRPEGIIAREYIEEHFSRTMMEMMMKDAMKHNRSLGYHATGNEDKKAGYRDFACVFVDMDKVALIRVDPTDISEEKSGKPKTLTRVSSTNRLPPANAPREQ